MQRPSHDQLPLRGLLGFAALALVAAAGGVAAISLLTACETQALYEACPLDEEVTKKGVCSGSTAAGHDTSSCVVTAHPQCDQSVCLSYFGRSAFCTRTCSSDAECGSGAFCWTYADAEPTATPPKAAQRYCVPDREKAAAINK